MGTHINIVLVVQLVGIGGKHSVHVEGIVLPPLQSEVDVHIAPRANLGCGIVAHVDVERINEAHLLQAVVLIPPFHLQVVTQGERDVTALTLARRTVEGVGILRIAHQRYVSVGIGLLVGIPVAVTRSSEVRGITEVHRRRKHVADSVYPVAEQLAVRNPGTIELGRKTYAHVPVIHVVETVDGITFLRLAGFIP